VEFLDDLDYLLSYFTQLVLAKQAPKPNLFWGFDILPWRDVKSGNREPIYPILAVFTKSSVDFPRSRLAFVRPSHSSDWDPAVIYSRILMDSLASCHA
jgi:hypothetical protein